MLKLTLDVKLKMLNVQSDFHKLLWFTRYMDVRLPYFLEFYRTTQFDPILMNRL